MSTPDRPETSQQLVVYSDYVCPFCYLGKASLDQYRTNREEPLDVEWRQFDLRGYKRRPDGSIDHEVDDGKDESYFEQARENVQQLKAQYDVEMELDLSMDVDSWNAQQAALFVQAELDGDAFARFHDAVFDAMWQEGRDIGDPDVLESIAESVDVDGASIRAAVESEEWESQLREQFAASQETGITGVPTFVYGEHAARGAVPPEQLQRLVEGV
ncbi:DsbA family oxidoreductase [Halorientalis salina]|uniref:DsbA family oxidoreductase n=1 Tax=Halorientalis salina TaxID=2932266 RepID=UPI0010AB8A11|nr:DsbA family protein [Halorientalis salina]